MDQRPPPPITIQGGPSGTVHVLSPDAASLDTVEGASDDVGAGPGRGRRLTSLLVAAAVGFGAATLLAERRQSTLDASPAGVLSLDLALQEPHFSSDLVESGGGAAVQAVVVLRNTGPRTIALESAELPGTGFAADDVAGRRVTPDSTTSVRLLRPIRCDDLAPLGSVGPLVVRATTGAGPRSTELRMETQSVAMSVHFARAACGLMAPGNSMVAVDVPPTRIAGDRAEVGIELSSTSRAPLVLRSLEVPAGLRVAGLRDEQGRAVTLPLRLPPGDYDPPTDPMRGRGPAQRLVAVVEVADCSALAEPSQDEMYVPLFHGTVTDERGRSSLEGVDDAFGGFGPGGSQWGDPSVLTRLRASACPVREPSLTTVPPASTQG